MAKRSPVFDELDAAFAQRIVIFDGADDGQLQNARAQFREAKAKGHPVSYWKQQARGWEKQA